ncbi:hypothetical protein C8J56DRAFT_1131343 [Mycena floridula]|nr:hypothetical protein C8J56DRAFT_1131343 [Mycena floridula]
MPTIVKLMVTASLKQLALSPSATISHFPSQLWLQGPPIQSLSRPFWSTATFRIKTRWVGGTLQRLRAIEKIGIIQDKIRQGAIPKAQAPVNLVAPNLTSFGHFVTLDIYQLQEHPKVGVVYFEQFEPSDGTDANTYFNGISNTLFTGLTALKAAGVEKILVDNSGNRGGFIFAGAISLWSLWPQDLYPGFPAVFRDLDLTRRKSDAAAATADQNSEYYFGFYRDVNYTLLTTNAQFLDPPVPQTVNGVADAYSQKFFDDFGNSSVDVTAFTAPPFAGEDYVFVANGICASTCSIFLSSRNMEYGLPFSESDYACVTSLRHTSDISAPITLHIICAFNIRLQRLRGVYLGILRQMPSRESCTSAEKRSILPL